MVSVDPCDRITPRSMTFCSSRTFPGHDQRQSISMLSREIDSTGRRSRFANRCAK